MVVWEQALRLRPVEAVRGWVRAKARQESAITATVRPARQESATRTDAEWASARVAWHQRLVKRHPAAEANSSRSLFLKKKTPPRAGFSFFKYHIHT